MDNICRFPKTGNLSDGLSILNFVFERTADFPPKYLTPANYAMNVVVSGSGILHTPCGDYPVIPGTFLHLKKRFELSAPLAL